MTNGENCEDSVGTWLPPLMVHSSTAPRGALHQNPAHGFGRHGEKLCAIRPCGLGVGPELQPGLMDQRGGLQGLAGRLLGHPVRGEFAQLLVNQRQQLSRWGQ